MLLSNNKSHNISPSLRKIYTIITISLDIEDWTWAENQPHVLIVAYIKEIYVSLGLDKIIKLDSE